MKEFCVDILLISTFTQTLMRLNMELIKDFFELIMHLDQHLNSLVQNYGTWTYLILFLIIFCETGLVVTPFLPGDSLLFALGALAARGILQIELLLMLLYMATICGDSVNYWIGYFTGAEIFEKKKIPFIKKEYLDRTHQFYEKHGGKTITLARYIPIIRTFAPFVAGVGRMNYGRFLIYSVFGGITWITIFLCVGYFFGNLPFIKENFIVVVMAIVGISLLPMAFEILRKFFQRSPKTDN